MKHRIPLCTAVVKLSVLSTILVLLFNAGLAQTVPTTSWYLGQSVPGITPKVFQLQVTPGLVAAERIAISSDNREIYYGELNGWPSTVQRIKYYKYSGTSWQGPFVAFEGYIAPSLSPDDSIMYMQKNLNNNTLTCTYYSRRIAGGWSTPQRLLSMTRNTHYLQQTSDHNFFTASTITGSAAAGDLCKLNIRNADTTLQSLGAPINSAATENDFFIARDESYIIFCRFPSGAAGDLYISFKKEDGTWTNPKTLGNQVNTPNPNWEACPFVTADNEYLFFMRGGNAMSSYFIYWVAIDNLIDSLRQTNYIPYLRFSLQNETFKTGRENILEIPDSTFIDDDGNNTLTFTAGLSNGNPLPAWLSFNADSKTFIGTPEVAGSFTIKLTVTDPDGATAFSTFTLRVLDASGVDEEFLQQKVTVFPNPAQDKISISFDGYVFHKTSISVINSIGEVIYSNITSSNTLSDIELRGNTSGIYLVRLNIDGIIISKKIFLL